MIIFKNSAKDTYFYLNPKTQSLGAMGSDYYILQRYLDVQINLIHVKNYKEIQKFQRILKKGEFKDTPPDQLKQAIMNTYPELFL